MWGWVILFIVLILAIWVLWIRALLDIRRHPDPRFREVGRTRAGTFWLVFCSGFVGGAYWFLVIRRELRRDAGGDLTPAS